MDGVLARRHALIARVVARARAEFASYMELDVDEISPGAQEMFEQILFALRDARPANASELEHFADYGRAQARVGMVMPEMLAAWRMAVREVVDEIARVATAHRAGDRLVLLLTTELLDRVDLAIRTFSAAYREVEVSRSGEALQQRSDFVRDLLAGSASPSYLHRDSALHGLDPGSDYVAFRSRITSVADREEVDRLIIGPPGSDRRGLVAAVDGDLAGIALADSLGASTTVTMGVGHPARLPDLASSFHAASRALETARSFDLKGVYSLPDLGLLVAVTSEPELGDRLVDTYITPLRGTNVEDMCETLEQYLDTGLNVEATASRLYLHANTVRYRLARFRELSKCELTSTRQVMELWWALKRRRARSEGAPGA